MLTDQAASPETTFSPGRRSLLQWTTMLAGASASLLTAAQAQDSSRMKTTPEQSGPARAQPGAGGLRKGMLSYMLAHEQFTAPELVQLGALASRSGFHALATSDHFQPWQANEGHAGQAWVTMSALGAQAPHTWMGTTVTCPTLRYNPAVVAEAFSTLSQLYPGRVYLGVGSGEALNEQAATGEWPKWQERWDRLIEAMDIIRALWTGQPVSHKGQYYSVEAKLYDPPPQPIPLLAAANGKKSMRLAGQYADGLISDPLTWKQHKSEWQEGARAAGKDPSRMPVLIEHYVVVGDKAAAEQAAELWRFGPKAFKGLYNVREPGEIEQKADAETPIDEVLKSWAVGTDPAVHVDAVRELFDDGVSIVNIHSGQPDQRRVIEFYGTHVLPKFRQPV